MACDICGKTGTHLEDLKSRYQTDDIKQICNECASSTNEQLWKLRALTQKMNKTWLKQFMMQLKKEPIRITKEGSE